VSLNEPIPRNRATDQPLVAQSDVAFQVVDLDNDRQPEILVDMFTGGTHCCTYSVIYRFDMQQRRYIPTSHSWGNSFYQLVDLNHDGKREFVSNDDRFTQKFTGYAASANPLQVWRYERGQMVDRTREYPQQIEANASATLLAMQRVSKNQHEAKGIIASYLADKYSLGRSEEGWQLVQQIYQGEDKGQFFEQLDQFLQRSGYVVSSNQSDAKQ
jgi:hypothetical protein